MIPVIVVALPVIDVSLAMFRRYKKGHRIMEPDKEHLHHRLMARGWTAREVVLLVYVLTLILSVSAIFLAIVKEPRLMSTAKSAPLKMMVVFGTRPEAIKMAPVCRSLLSAPKISRRPWCSPGSIARCSTRS